MTKAILSTALTISLAGCGVNGSRNAGETLAEQYFAAAGRGDTDSVIEMYDAAFMKAAPEWPGTYKVIRDRLGKPETHLLVNWRVNTLTGTSASGRYVTLVYSVQYERARGSEVIEVAVSSNQPQIHAHQFNSNALFPKIN